MAKDEHGGKDSTPDPDEVRRALARMRDQSPRLYSFERVVCEAAEAWLRDQGRG